MTEAHDRGQAAPLRWGGLAWRAAVVLAIVALFVGYIVAVHGTGNADEDSTDGAVAEQRQVVARGRPVTIAVAVKRWVGVYGHADDARPWRTMRTPNDLGAPLTFLVLSKEPGWVHVLLPTRPNGSTGWVRSSDVGLSHTDYRIDVSLSRHRMQLRKRNATILDRPVAVGAAKTPTPKGLFYVTVLLRPPDPDGAYGPYAFGLSGHSTVLFHFGGGPGQIGLHGTNEPESLGGSVSSGCIRVSDATVRRLATIVPLGTPVTVSG